MKNGFTLVELSIVLVIIGLLIGGILVGQSLNESAKVRAQVGAFQQYDIALRGFYQKFKGIPGDSYENPTTNGFPPTEDGVLRDFIGLVPINWIWSESSSYFPALSQYGFIKDNYRMVHGSAAVGKGSPYPRLMVNAGEFRALLALTNTSGEVFYYVGINNGVTHSNPTIGSMSPGIMSPEQAAAIDNKMDDGLPSTGDVTATTTTRVGTVGAALPYAVDAASACIAVGTPNQYNASNPSNTLCRLLVKAANYK